MIAVGKANCKEIEADVKISPFISIVIACCQLKKDSELSVTVEKREKQQVLAPQGRNGFLLPLALESKWWRGGYGYVVHDGACQLFAVETSPRQTWKTRCCCDQMNDMSVAMRQEPIYSKLKKELSCTVVMYDSEWAVIMCTAAMSLLIRGLPCLHVLLYVGLFLLVIEWDVMRNSFIVENVLWSWRETIWKKLFCCKTRKVKFRLFIETMWTDTR